MAGVLGISLISTCGFFWGATLNYLGISCWWYCHELSWASSVDVSWISQGVCAPCVSSWRSDPNFEVFVVMCLFVLDAILSPTTMIIEDFSWCSHSNPQRSREAPQSSPFFQKGCFSMATLLSCLIPQSCCSSSLASICSLPVFMEIVYEPSGCNRCLIASLLGSSLSFKKGWKICTPPEFITKWLDACASRPLDGCVTTCVGHGKLWKKTLIVYGSFFFHFDRFSRVCCVYLSWWLFFTTFPVHHFKQKILFSL